MKRHLSIFVALLVLTVLAVLAGHWFEPQPTAVSAAPAEVPAILVEQDAIDSITTSSTKVWYWYWNFCPVPRTPFNDPTTQIARVPAFGGLTRSVYAEYLGACGNDTDLGSNVVADEQYLYWMSRYQDALVRLPVTANEGDPPTSIYAGETVAVQVREVGNWVYLLHQDYGIKRVLKQVNPFLPPVVETIVTAAELGPGFPSRLWVTGNRVLWWTNGTLYQRAINGGLVTFTGNVTSFASQVCIGGCTPEVVYAAKTNVIWQYPTGQGGSIIYTSPLTNAEIVEIRVDADNLYFIERRELQVGVDIFYDFGLYRLSRSGGNAALIYTKQNVSEFEYLTFNLALGGPDENYLFWHEHGTLKRLARDAEALPVVDIAVTQIEVTQGIQNATQSIGLIRGKWTGVRVFVSGDGANVPGVAALLYRLDAGGNVIGGPLTPDNNYMTAQNNPQREVLEHAFYFRLPHAWTVGENLRLLAVVNPNQIPDEPNFANNIMVTPLFTMRPSPNLPVFLLLWQFEINGNSYSPRPLRDVAQTKSWFQRVYPVGATNINFDERVIVDEELGARIQRIGDDCEALLTDDADNRNTCAALYVNARAAELRAAEEWDSNTFIYSMLFHDPANPDLPFPRGLATGGRISSGPAGPHNFGWDFDGSSADFYMGHEVGHSVTGGHPQGMNAACGHSTQDSNFPRSDLSIGSDSMWGFDVGAAGLNPLLVPAVLPNDQWTDFMSYCNNQWVSDYNYEVIYNNLINDNSLRRRNTPVGVGENYLALFGAIVEANHTAIVSVLRLWDSPGPYGPPMGDHYQVQLRDADENVLASYNFDTNQHDHDGGTTSDQSVAEEFTVVGPFAPGTTSIVLRDLRHDVVLRTIPVSANAPVVSGVTAVIQGDKVVIEWQSQDPDNDPLTWDVYYSPNGGTTWTAHHLGLKSTSTAIPLSDMAGSSFGRFRVVAHDGVRSGEGQSDPTPIPPNPPRIRFLDPANLHEVPYGTPISFFADVFDRQGAVNPQNTTWYINGQVVASGTGFAHTAWLLPVGVHRVSLQVVNSVGLPAMESINVVVNDDVGYPPARLAAGPTQLGWQVGRYTTAPQTRVVTVSNVGTGELTWNASTTAAWLQLEPDPEAGTLTVHADPSQIQVGESDYAFINILAENGQRVRIPVSLHRGPSPYWTTWPFAGFDLFMPSVFR